MELIDTHAHLDDEQFDSDLPQVLARAREAGVVAVLAVATTAESSTRTAALAGRFPDVYAAVGIHPNYAGAAASDDWTTIERLAAAPRVVAIGETGLDRYREHTPFALQEEFFARHLELSRRTGLPVIIHCRDTEADVLAALSREATSGPVRGVMHSFTGGAETAAVCLELGLFLSFAGMVTYKHSDALRAVAREVPPDRLLVETDSPYLSPHPYRGKRNEPARVVHTAACLAEVKGLSLEDFARLTTANARKLFVLPEDASL